VGRRGVNRAIDSDGQPMLLAPDAAAEPTSLVVTVDTGDRIHYLDWGQPGADSGGGSDSPARLPPLLLVHGLGQTSWLWAPVARRLAHATHVLAADLRGHGASDQPRSGYDLGSLAYDMLTVLAGAGYGETAGRPAAVAGHGFGAMVAATMAAVQPTAVAGLALVDGGWEDVAESTGQHPTEFLHGLGDPPEVTRSMATYLADRRDYDPATWDPDQERAARSAVDEKAAGHVAPVARPHVLKACVEAMFAYRPLETVAPLDVALLIAQAEAGTADDEVARERSLALADLLARREEHGAAAARVARFPGAGHNLMRYRPDQLSAELLALLESATRPGASARRT
jgi:pimeloyl-ACP methyl ester carboxylesterase